MTSRLRLAPGSRALKGFSGFSRPPSQLQLRTPRLSPLPSSSDLPSRCRPHEERSAPLLPAESWSSAERRLPRTQRRISPPGPPLRLPPGLLNPVGQHFPRLGLQMMLFLFCS